MAPMHGNARVDRQLSWSETFGVGHEALDNEHRRLIKAINDVCAACDGDGSRGALHALFAALERETVKHFAHENTVMNEIFAGRSRKLPGEVKAMTGRAIKGHLAEHERNLADLRKIMRAAEADSGCDLAQTSAELKRWFLDHAVKYDSQLKAIFQAL